MITWTIGVRKSQPSQFAGHACGVAPSTRAAVAAMRQIRDGYRLAGQVSYALVFRLRRPARVNVTRQVFGGGQ